ncbi:K(+) efflux antiporter 3, chloroplastic [Apostasia shenzhenica]|uniref:K(+) efflux antiporter 3, chloroplastic n=1 Tax=Apostasia shenzhenica TaxID=1088818 RepID=A0A2I0A5S9_9ASPA|nr:K(+) efflux antiporter 3, chloroplastic [Apostasia shenzhenica]
MADSRCLSGGAACRWICASSDHRRGFSGIRRRFSEIPFFHRWNGKEFSSSAASRGCCRVRFVPVGVPGAFGLRWSRGRFDLEGCQRMARSGFRICAGIDVASAVDVINDLGFDTLTFLVVTVVVVPAFRFIRASPILGFFSAGVVLNQLGLFRNLVDVKVLSEWGILFLLFEMGLELSFARLRALAKYAFGIGLTQVVLSTLAFTAFELPPNGAIGTKVLEFLFHSRPDLVNIRSVDEAIVIGAALSLSSSAFVLQKTWTTIC